MLLNSKLEDLPLTRCSALSGMLSQTYNMQDKQNKLRQMFRRFRLRHCDKTVPVELWFDWESPSVNVKVCMEYAWH